MKQLLYIITVAIVLVLSACGRSADGAESAMADIDTALAAGDMNEAQRLCDRLLADTTMLDTVPVPTLCRMAVVLTRLAENGEYNDENTAQAVLCYRTALNRDSAAAMTYFNSLPTDDYKHVYMLRELLRRITDREQGVVYSTDDYEQEPDEAHEHEH